MDLEDLDNPVFENANNARKMSFVSEKRNEKNFERKFFGTISGSWTPGPEKKFGSEMDPKVLGGPAFENANKR